MAWHILVVEADASLNERLVNQLQLGGFEVTSVQEGGAALQFIEHKGLPHLVVLDLALPDMDGFELIENLSQKGVPLIVTAENSLHLAVRCLQWADDFVRKPYAPEELIARIQRSLSRMTDFSYAGGPVVELDARVSFDYAHNRLIIEGEPVRLTTTESRLLHTLLQHKGRIVDREALIARVWPAGGIYEDTLRVHLHRLRKKLEVDPSNPKYILTERGVGYRFEA